MVCNWTGPLAYLSRFSVKYWIRVKLLTGTSLYLLVKFSMFQKLFNFLFVLGLFWTRVYSAKINETLMHLEGAFVPNLKLYLDQDNIGAIFLNCVMNSWIGNKWHLKLEMEMTKFIFWSERIGFKVNAFYIFFTLLKMLSSFESWPKKVFHSRVP